jgi:hypothetical protein
VPAPMKPPHRPRILPPNELSSLTSMNTPIRQRLLSHFQQRPSRLVFNSYHTRRICPAMAQPNGANGALPVEVPADKDKDSPRKMKILMLHGLFLPFQIQARAKLTLHVQATHNPAPSSTPKRAPSKNCSRNPSLRNLPPHSMRPFLEG